MLPVPALPADTLPNWPAVAEPSLVELLTLTVFIPFGFAAVVAAIVLAPAWRKSEG